MNDAVPERIPQTQPAFSGRPPGPPKITARDLAAWPADEPGKTIYFPDQVVVRDLASSIGVKPFLVVADLLALRQFKNADEEVDFATASIIARNHGYRTPNHFPVAVPEF